MEFSNASYENPQPKKMKCFNCGSDQCFKETLNGEIFNIGGEQEIKIKYVAKLIMKLSKTKGVLKYLSHLKTFRLSLNNLSQS